MSQMGQSRHFDRGLVTSGPPLETDILSAVRHVSKVPMGDMRPLSSSSLAGYVCIALAAAQHDLTP